MRGIGYAVEGHDEEEREMMPLLNKYHIMQTGVPNQERTRTTHTPTHAGVYRTNAAAKWFCCGFIYTCYDT